MLPVYDKPVIYYAIEKLVDAGITKIMVVTSPSNIDSFVKLLGSGQRFVPKGTTAKQIQIVYGIQNEPNGIAYGLFIAEDYIGKDNCVLFLGDNIFLDDITLSHTEIQKARPCSSKSARPEAVWYRYREARQNHLARGKTRQAERRHGRDGTHIYDNTVFKKIRKIPPSERGEYEITDVNKLYLEEGSLHHHVLNKEWFDIGTIESLHTASRFMKQRAKK